MGTVVVFGIKVKSEELSGYCSMGNHAQNRTTEPLAACWDGCPCPCHQFTSDWAYVIGFFTGKKVVTP